MSFLLRPVQEMLEHQTLLKIRTNLFFYLVASKPSIPSFSADVPGCPIGIPNVGAILAEVLVTAEQHVDKAGLAHLCPTHDQEAGTRITDNIAGNVKMSINEKV